MHRERTGTHRNAQEFTGAHGRERERHIISNKGNHKFPINEQTSMHLPSSVSVYSVLFFLLLLRRLFEFKQYP